MEADRAAVQISVDQLRSELDQFRDEIEAEIAKALEPPVTTLNPAYGSLPVTARSDYSVIDVTPNPGESFAKSGD